MFDSEFCLRLHQLKDVEFECRPHPLKKEYELWIRSERNGLYIRLTNEQRERLLLELHRAPKNEELIIGG